MKKIIGRTELKIMSCAIVFWFVTALFITGVYADSEDNVNPDSFGKDKKISSRLAHAK